MTIDIGAVLSTCWTMMKRRFWPMVALWAIFVGISVIFSTIGGAIFGFSMLGVGAVASDGIENPLALGGVGVIAFIAMFVFYVLYLAIAFAQQASMTVMASPTQDPDLGEAIRTGFRAGLTYAVLLVLLGFAAGVLALIAALMTAVSSMLGEGLAVVTALAMAPLIIYLFCRFAVLMPVVAVERVFNPIKALNRTWAVTQGNVLGIFLVTLIGLVTGLLVIMVPFLLLLGSGVGLAMNQDAAGPSAGSIGLISLAFLLLFPLFVVWQVFSVSLYASLHAAISDDHIDKVSEVFE